MAEITEKNPRGAGRKAKTVQRATTQRILTDASPKAAAYLTEVIKGKVKPEWGKIDVCKYVINQDLGAPRQKMEHTGADGERLSYTELIILAERVEKERAINPSGNGDGTDKKETGSLPLGEPKPEDTPDK
ncbi:MAG TPA: hypothetical protein G4N93_06985 [Dehalococcoidia bacterium]|nr:hypothetical protein [Dehalococcoidia bacterium]